MLKTRLLLTLTAALGSLGWAADPPAIIQIRANYEAVNRKISTGQYKKEAFFDKCLVADFVRWTDEKGRLRRLNRTVYYDTMPASEAHWTALWFDAAGRLDFALAQSKYSYYERETGKDGVAYDVRRNGQPVFYKTERFETRFYFDNRGRILRQFSNPPSEPEKPDSEFMTQLLALATTPWKTLQAQCKE